ncbi:hypothetical protein AB0D97_14295 [Streptomyces roseus]|uniref:hypothetical protein n=1 Tax=Streptomyces roseus TaxID=66430 RepID=UPI0033FAB263
MQYEERYVIRYSDGTRDALEEPHDDESTAQAFDNAVKGMPPGSRVELERQMIVTIATASRA